jgi:hypothetical protein
MKVNSKDIYYRLIDLKIRDRLSVSRNKINSVVFWGLIFTLFGCTSIAHKTQVFNGENLITPYSGFLAGWKVFVENKDHYYSQMWQHPELGLKDAYVVSVTPSEKMNLVHFRKIIDKPGIDSCTKFTSETINSSQQAIFPKEFWRTHCLRKDGSEAQILHLLIKGTDSLYHIQKIWQESLAVNELSTWKKRFEQIYVCDTRSLKPNCPI